MTQLEKIVGYREAINKEANTPDEERVKAPIERMMDEMDGIKTFKELYEEIKSAY